MAQTDRLQPETKLDGYETQAPLSSNLVPTRICETALGIHPAVLVDLLARQPIHHTPR
jgi:hypothetical protein